MCIRDRYKVTRDWVVMRGMMAVAPIAEDDMDLLVACHRLIGVEVTALSLIHISST